jgi:hypothetical protein
VATANSAYNGSPASLTDLIAGNMDGGGGAADRASLATKLSGITTSINAVPDLNSLADDLAALNTQLTNLRTSRLVDGLSYNITLIKNTMASMPQPSALSVLVQTLNSTVSGITLVPIRGTLVTFNSTLSGGGGGGGAFNFSGIIREVNKIDGLGNVIGCASTVVDEVEGLLLATLTQLPSMLSTVTDMIGSVNTTYQQAKSQASAFGSTLANLNSFGGAGFNLKTYIDLVDSLQTQLTSSSIVNFTAILNGLNTAQSSMGAFNLTTVLSNVAALNATIWDDSIMASPASISGLRNMQTTLTTLGGTITAASTRLATFSSHGGARTCVTANTACTQDSNCPVGDQCAYGPEFGTCAAALNSYATANPTPNTVAASFTTLATQISPASTTVQNTPALSTLFTQVGSFQSTINSVLTPTIVNSVSQMATQLDPNTLGLNTVDSAITSALSAIGSIDLNGIKAQMVSFNDGFGPMKTQISSTLKMVGSAVDAASTLFTVTLPAVLPRLAKPVLNQKTTLTGVITELADVADVLLAVVKNATASTFTLPVSNVTEMAGKYLDYAAVLTDPTYAEAGPLYFFTSFPGLESMGGVNATVAGTTGTVFRDSTGKAWPGGKKCFTDSCVVNTIKALNQKPIFEGMNALAATDSAAPLNLPLSREQIMALPFLIPLIIALMGCCGATIPFGKRNFQRCCTCCSAFWICVVLPWLFLFAAVIFWPMVMMVSDTCRGAPNLGYQFIKGSEGAVCNMLPGGSMTSNGCSLTLQGETITIPVANVYGALLGSCANYPTALSGVYSDLAKAANVIPGKFLNSSIDSFFADNTTAPMGLVPKASVLQIPKDLGTNIGAAAKALVTDFGDAFSCDILNADIARISESVSCHSLLAAIDV